MLLKWKICGVLAFRMKRLLTLVKNIFKRCCSLLSANNWKRFCVMHYLHSYEPGGKKSGRRTGKFWPGTVILLLFSGFSFHHTLMKIYQHGGLEDHNAHHFEWRLWSLCQKVNYSIHHAVCNMACINSTLTCKKDGFIFLHLFFGALFVHGPSMVYHEGGQPLKDHGYECKLD